MFGYSSLEEFKEIAVCDLYQRSEERKDFVYGINKRGFVKDKELELKKKDGTPIICSCTAVAQREEDGNIKWIEGVIEDITDRKKAEEELKVLQESLKVEKQKL